MLILARSATRFLARIVDGIAQGLRLLGALALVFMALSVFYDTMMRYLFLAPTSWSLEVNSFLVAFIAFIPAGQVLREREHLRIGLIQDRLTGPAALTLATLIGAIGVAFSAIVAWRGALMAHQAWLYDERMSTVLGTPMVLPYAMIPIGFGVLGFAFLTNLLEAWTREGDAPAAGPDRPHP